MTQGPNLLKAWRVGQGMSQADAAKFFDFSQASISDYENRRRTPTGDQAFEMERLTKAAVPAASWFASASRKRSTAQKVA